MAAPPAAGCSLSYTRGVGGTCRPRSGGLPIYSEAAIQLASMDLYAPALAVLRLVLEQMAVDRLLFAGN